MNAIIQKTLLILALVLATSAFVLCIIIGASPFIGFSPDTVAPAVLILFIGVFPLFFGAVLVLVRRAKGRFLKDWVPILFSGLPQWFCVIYRCYFFLICLGGIVAFIQSFWGQPSLAGLLFVFVPSVFYATCAGAYWSALRAQAKGEKSLTADGKEDAAEG